ncbi:hypothetical protein EYF80_041478 [Liparis tanakae]|uniref:Uncharacterized protein n=1 Tax=Liparis tanakae TaxID=230148 RepID=A0A4Z2G425_9TELE|nr:hypothetical protein EYF80_041478 [Liparis tanakae]
MPMGEGAGGAGMLCSGLVLTCGRVARRRRCLGVLEKTGWISRYSMEEEATVPGGARGELRWPPANEKEAARFPAATCKLFLKARGQTAHYNQPSTTSPLQPALYNQPSTTSPLPPALYNQLYNQLYNHPSTTSSLQPALQPAL